MEAAAVAVEATSRSPPDHRVGAKAAPASSVTTQKSPLEKPLGELTEDDIAQVTREDCRRFLKEKGMRRPSWNKSQAIQQVISLKALLEAKPVEDDDDKKPIDPPPPVSSLPPPPPPRPPPPPPPPSLQKDEDAPYRRRYPAPPHFAPADAPFRIPQEVTSVSPRASVAAPPPPEGQMTIFYGGRVHVYEAVSPEKAMAIMRLAASREARDCYLRPPNPVDMDRSVLLSHPGSVQPLGSLAPRPHPPPAGHRAAGIGTPVNRLPQYLREGVDWKNTRESEPEGPTCRKASLQRYLEKRKDRRIFKCKKSIENPSPSSMEMYLSQKLRSQPPNGLHCRSDNGSPTYPKPPRTPTRCSSIENQTQNIRFLFDLNDDDVQDV